MRVVVSSANLSEAVSAASRVTPARPAMMAYSAIMINAKSGAISVTGSDGDLSVRCSVDGTVQEDGVTLVQPRPLAARPATRRSAVPPPPRGASDAFDVLKLPEHARLVAVEPQLSLARACSRAATAS